MEENQTMNVKEKTEEYTPRLITETEKSSFQEFQNNHNKILIDLGDIVMGMENVKSRKETAMASVKEGETNFNKYFSLLKAKYEFVDTTNAEQLKEILEESEFTKLGELQTEVRDGLAKLGDSEIAEITLNNSKENLLEKSNNIKTEIESFLSTLKYKYELKDTDKINFQTGEILEQ